MRPEEFTGTAPGRVIRSVLGHWTFQPDPLPPVLTLDLELARLLSEADRALGELAGVGCMLPNPHLLIRPFLSREAVLSSRIEGTVTTLDQLFLFEAQPDEIRHQADAEEVRNYVLALEDGLGAIRRGMPFTLQLIRGVHRTLLSGVRGEEKRPGELRTRPVFIGQSNQTLDNARFVPPCHTALEPLLADFVRFLREERSLPPVVQLALMHYQFEAIHPFNDGNGRVGRLLITLMLCERGVLPQPLLYLSAFFEKNRAEYYDHLLAISRTGEWREWLVYFAFGVAEQARDATLRARRLLNLWQDYRHRAAQAARAATILRLVDAMFSSPYLTAQRVSDVMEMSFKSAQKNVDKLVAAGLLREVTGQKRYRVYCADEILSLLDEPLDALTTAPPPLPEVAADGP